MADDEEFFAWKTRDAAEELLAGRRDAVALAAMALEGGGAGGGPGPPAAPGAAMLMMAMPVWDEFDAAGTRQRLFHGRAAQVRRAFDAAASCVLRALASPPEIQMTGDEGGAGGDARASCSLALLLDDPDLPPALRDWARLEQSRRHTFDRTRHNKEHVKVAGGGGGGGGGGRKSKAGASAEGVAADAVPALSASGSNLGDPVANSKLAQADAPLPPAAVASSSSASGDAAVDGADPSQPPPAAAAAPPAAPKFTRNTPASSSAALDFRLNSSRAVLCAAGNLVFEALTPPPAPGHPLHLDALGVPQNPNAGGKLPAAASSKSKNSASASASRAASGSGSSLLQVNMGAVVVEAQLLSQRTVAVVENAVRRSELRDLYRKTNAKFDLDAEVDEHGFLRIPNPYLLRRQVSNDSEVADAAGRDPGAGADEDLQVETLGVPHRPNPLARTDAWRDACLPRLLGILARGAGHAIYHDYHWKSRHGRVADLLRHLPSRHGPHLVVTIGPDVPAFCQEFDTAHVGGLVRRPSPALRAVAYRGTPDQRRALRTRFFRSGTGLEASGWHVMVTSYSDLLQDFLHFSQIPLDSVVLDDGALWMAAAHADLNSALGSIWENLFAKNDQQIGLAGTGLTGDGASSGGDEDSGWNFALDGQNLPESLVKDGWVGLTCRHRILTSSAMSLDQSRGQDKVPVSGLLSFVMPHFADAVREEWDRSRISSDADSMDHFRALVARSTVAHCVGYVEPSPASSQSSPQEDQAMLALNGKLEARERSDPAIPEVVYDDAFVSDGKINFSRRSCLSWLGRLERSWLRYELGKAMLQHILDAMKVSNRHGHICEEITTASSTTSSGATGQVVGTMAYRLAIRCCRHFGSEQGLRQHVSALHAPPGTWLCRTCGVDCLTSHSRTHHERSCGVPGQGSSILGEPGGGSVGATPTVGQGSAAGKAGVGKKKPGRSSSSQQASGAEEKDADGSFRVPGYRGVWVNQAGKHFVKIDGTGLNREGTEELWLFDNMDDAARKHDEVRKREKKGKLELNFKADGSRIVYEDVTPASTSGLGGSATTVVPALSIINIKDLPPDVKPLLRDPRQTSRTGGNSKRHVYAYRGVCRQARKGHDRWQSQISFMGVNHYLGTFDSEWDAAAIYAWAHLILYGEEATRQAQKEGEEAAAAYEREQQDIAAGRLPEPSPKKKPKKTPTKKEGTAPDTKEGADGAAKPEGAAPKKRKSIKDTGGAAPEKKTKTNTKACKLEKEAIGSTVAKGITRASVIAPKDQFEDFTDEDLIALTGTKLRAARSYDSDRPFGLPAADPLVRPCIPVRAGITPLGGALLVGLSPNEFGWDLQEFLTSQGAAQDMMAIQMLAVEYDDDGVNEKFSTVMQGSFCIVGRASDGLQRAYKTLGLGAIPLGGSAGKLDCHIGGIPGSCGESAACIRRSATADCPFRLSCLSEDDVVTLNGQRIAVESGSVPLFGDDVISVGARVFAFVPASNKKQ